MRIVGELYGRQNRNVKIMNDNNIPLANSKVGYQTLLEDEWYSVSTTTVRPGGETGWHYHSGIEDRFVVVKGILTVEIKVGGNIEIIRVRDYFSVNVGVVHHVRNETDEDVVYVMIQSGGVRDIVIERTTLASR